MKKIVYDNVQRLCDEKNISVAKLEHEIGLSNGAIGKWKDSSPKLNTAKLVADYFGVTVDDLLK